LVRGIEVAPVAGALRTTFGSKLIEVLDDDHPLVISVHQS
jgi:hypothetical protein